MTEDADGFIDSVAVGGRGAWYMLGHTFWDAEFTRKFLAILDRIYDDERTAGLLWESIFAEHLDELKMRIRKYPDDEIYEFDTLDELRLFDPTYVDDTRSSIIADVARRLGCRQRDITGVVSFRSTDNAAAGFRFTAGGSRFEYDYETKSLKGAEEK